MPGVRGKSGGKAITAEEKAKKAAAGAARGASVARQHLLDPKAKDPEKRLGLPVTWGDELKRRQVEGEAIQNRRREVEVQRAQVELENARDAASEARGRLVSKSELDRTAAIIRDAWWREAQRITSDVLAAIPGMPVDARALIKTTVDAAVTAAADRVKRSLEGSKG